MALIKCKECKTEISDKAKNCPSCGVPVKSRIGCGGFIVILFCIGVVMYNLPSIISPVKTSTQIASQQARLATMTPEQRAQEEKKRKEEAAAEEERRLQQLGLRWNYEESLDKMGRGTIKNATVNSVNEIQFGFPYQGSQRGTLQLRIHPKYGKDVILSIEKGQFLCGIDSCTVAVRFDQGTAQAYSASEAADHRTTVLFLQNYDLFLGNVRKSKKVYIEAQFYQEGARVFEFDIMGLKW